MRFINGKLSEEVMFMLLIGADSRDAFGRCGGIKPGRGG
jgi:hypothetical protein